MVERRHQDDALAVRERGPCEPADGAIEKVLILIELDDVLARSGLRHHLNPWLTVCGAVHFTFKLAVHGIVPGSKNGIGCRPQAEPACSRTARSGAERLVQEPIDHQGRAVMP